MENKIEILNRLVKAGHIDLKEAIILMETEKEQVIVNHYPHVNIPSIWQENTTPIVYPYTFTCTAN